MKFKAYAIAGYWWFGYESKGKWTPLYRGQRVGDCGRWGQRTQ